MQSRVKRNGYLCGCRRSGSCSIRRMNLTTTVTLDSACQSLALGWSAYRADSNLRPFSGELRPSHWSSCPATERPLLTARQPERAAPRLSVGRWQRDGRGRASSTRVERRISWVSTRQDVGDSSDEPQVTPRRSTRQQRHSSRVAQTHDRLFIYRVRVSTKTQMKENKKR